MNNNLYSRLQYALRDSNIDSLKRLYDENLDNLDIKFEYAKRLKLYDLNFSKQLLLELVNDRRFKNKYATFIQLGIIEFKRNNNDKARECFEKLLDSKRSLIAKLWLGKLEASEERNLQVMLYLNEKKY